GGPSSDDRTPGDQVHLHTVYERSLEHTSTRACRRAGLRASPRVEVNHVPHANAAEQARSSLPIQCGS
ncbi:MAG TPA: hypothetical protein VHX12_09020, partial [Acidisoma sp.]|nr:hypothetical protein [Acidisoma sp.]